MSLISRSDLIKVSGLGRFGFLKNPVASAIMSLTKIDEVNKLYDVLKDKTGKDFFDSFVRERDLKYIVFEEDLARIPKTGPFILVSNHPLGAIDGILMAKILTEIRPDFKIMGNFLLEKIKPMEPYVIPVNPFENRKEARNSATGMRETLKHLESGGCVGIFPAGEVSNKNNEFGEIRDKAWEKPALKLIRMAKVPVVPMYFHAKNSRLFYRLAKMHPDLQTLLLPAEMMHKREKPIRIRIGKCVSVKMLDDHDSIEEMSDFLQKKIYMLKSYYEKRKSLADQLKLPNLKLNFLLTKEENVVQNIIDETPHEDIEKEINALHRKDKMLFRNGNYEVFFCTYTEIPSIMREIGRQRELTFRKIGEGSNLPFDLDHYDEHYHHLFLWDSSAKKLVGAYRMALGGEVM
ncbi:MAG: lysophospholipid acyltransferase family protein, partial [Kaistella sp.]